MNRLCVCLVCVVALVATLGAAGQPQPDSTEADRLVKLLGSARFGEREAAFKALDALGPAALPALRRAAQGEDAEVRRRVGELIAKYERQADADAAFAPTKVHLKANGTPLGTVLQDLVKQAQITIHLAREPFDLTERPVTLDTGATSFWEALDALCRQARLSIRPEEFDPAPSQDLRLSSVSAASSARTAEPPLVLQDGVLPSCPTAYLGAVRLRLLPLRWDNRGRGPGAEHRWALEVLSEPRLRWQGSPLCQFESAAGLTIRSGTPDVQPNTAASNGPVTASVAPGPRPVTRHEFPVYLKTDSAAGAALAEFRGTLAGLAQLTERQTIAIPDVSKAGGVEATIPDGAKLTMQECTVDPAGAVKLKVDVERPEPAGAGPNTSHSFGGTGGIVPSSSTTSALIRFGRDGESFRLFDTRDQEYTVTLRLNMARRQGGTTTVTYTLEAPPTAAGAQPRKLEFQMPRRTSVEKKFTFRDVRLPG